MTYKIVYDSAANVIKPAIENSSSVPLHMIIDGVDYVDDATLNLDQFKEKLQQCEKSGTACASVMDWMAAFGDAETIFCITITGALSGNYASAMIAKETYEETYPNRKVYVIDSKSAGPKMALIVEKVAALIADGMAPQVIATEIEKAKRKTELLFVLSSLTNLAKNGRVSPLLAKVTGMMGIRVVGRSSTAGEFEMIAKHRGEKKAFKDILNEMAKSGYSSGKVQIAHHDHLDGAEKLKQLIMDRFNTKEVQIVETTALCSYYAEDGGIMLGFEIK